MANVIEEIKKINWSTTNQNKKIITNELIRCISNNNYISIQEFSKLTFISRSSITRFCQSLNFEGYSDLISVLKHEFTKLESKSEDTSTEWICMIQNEIKSLNKYLKTLDKLVGEIMNVKGKVFLFSSHDTFLSVIQFNNQLAISGINSVVVFDYTLLFYNQLKVKKDDVAIFFISGFNNDDIIEIFKNFSYENKNVWCFTSIKQRSKFILNEDRVIIYNPLNTSGNYIIRKMIVEFYFAYITSKLKNNV